MQPSSQLFIFVFAPLALTVFWLLPQRWRIVWLIVVSYAFYATWDWRFCLLLLTTTAIDYTAGRRIATSPTRPRARGWLLVSLIANLGLLAFFKYAGFAARSVNALSALLGGGEPAPVLDILLPVGISFYTFQSLTQTIDVYWRRARPARSFWQYAAFVSLFATLIAGPIVRWQQLEAQLQNWPRWLPRERLALGLTFFFAGLIKKVLIADQLRYIVDPLWTDYLHLSCLESWVAVLGYSLQIFFDFAGYSLMAIGLGHLLGLALPQNFNAPYRARDISDFWRRWHMSLSFWLRDYLFIPLGGLHYQRRWLALLLTMLLAGLWHGPAWTFVLWGGVHGLLLAAHHALRALKLRWRGGWAGQLGTFILVTLAWVLFRAPTMEIAGRFYKSLFAFETAAAPLAIPRLYLAVTLLALFWALFAPSTFELIHTRQARPRLAVLVGLGVLATIAVLTLADSTPFLYAQF